MIPRKGLILKHPDGYYVQIIDTIDGLWFWKEVMKDGTLGRLCWGEGWDAAA